VACPTWLRVSTKADGRSRKVTTAENGMRNLRALDLTRGAGPLTYLSRRYFGGRKERHARNRRNTTSCVRGIFRAKWLAVNRV
jgi:hypothetical protein